MPFSFGLLYWPPKDLLQQWKSLVPASVSCGVQQVCFSLSHAQGSRQEVLVRRYTEVLSGRQIYGSAERQANVRKC